MTPFRGKLKIRHLEIVLAVAEFGSLSSAANHLHLTQSGLSRAIAEIEETSGGRLFERSAKGMVCTSLGLAMCRHASILLGDLRKAETDLAAVARGQLGSLTVGCFTMFSGWPLADTVSAYHAAQPGVALNAEIGSHEALLAALDSGSLDILLSRCSPSLSEEIYRRELLLSDAVVLTCAPRHPLAGDAAPSLADCTGFPWVTAPPGNIIQEALEQRLAAAGMPLPHMIGVLSLEFGSKLLADGYLWLLPESIAHIRQAQGELQILPLTLGLRAGPMAVIWRRDRPCGKQARAFIDTLQVVIDSAMPVAPFRIAQDS